MKYLQLRELSEQEVAETEIPTHMLSRTDIVLLLFEANDTEQVEFIKETYAKLS